MKKKEIKQSKLRNDQNQEAFIVIKINNKLRVFLLRLLCKILFFKNTDPKNQIRLFSFCQPIDPIFFAVLPVDQKINLVSPK